jgi:anti-sigma regulatory factor (Ser/Thr protein kinase)
LSLTAVAAAPSPEAFEYSIGVPHDARAVGVARTALRAALAAHGLQELIERAEPLASEMLSNAYRYTSGEAQLRLKWAREILRITVWDTCPKPPGFKDVRGDSEGGRGLHLLAVVADRWDHYPIPTGLLGAVTKVVWCEIGRKPTGAW